ncbi:unnamed protein product [Symbiodinium microadriaticum]|nr:unnamed protein product [Symbiodinium microadriaticum]
MFRFAIALLIAVARSRRSGEIELTRERAECQAVDSTKAYFDGLRDKYQIQECTKRDVCLLMRQLDAYFYTRARQGKLVSYDSPPQRSWVYDGRCEKNARSIKLAPITKLPACKAAVRAKGIQKVKVVNSTTLPTGCSIKTQRTSKAYLNKLETKVEAGLTYEDTKHWSQTNKKEIAQYCEVDHSLSEAAASYYSPYKLKQSMKERPEKSASCSFGMMANLSKLELTASPCAEILSFTPQHTTSYGGAAAALKAADKLQAEGKEEEADDIRTEVQNIRNKFVLIQLITTDCWAQNDFDHDFGIGEFAARAEYLVRGIGGETKEALMESRTPKMGLAEGTCEGISDVVLDDILDDVSDETPPDFFAKATV